jgi:hypothetical protein
MGWELGVRHGHEGPVTCFCDAHPPSGGWILPDPILTKRPSAIEIIAELFDRRFIRITETVCNLILNYGRLGRQAVDHLMVCSPYRRCVCNLLDPVVSIKAYLQPGDCAQPDGEA